MKIMGIDGSLTATGLAVVHLECAGDRWRGRVIDARCVRTEPDKRQRHTYQADQDGQRVDAIVDSVLAMISDHAPELVAIEAPAGAQSAKAAKALGLVYGALRAACRARGRTPVMVQAHHAKEAATGSSGASKDDVVEAMEALFGAGHLSGPKVRREAVADALSVVCGSLKDPMVKTLVEARMERGIAFAERAMATIPSDDEVQP